MIRTLGIFQLPPSRSIPAFGPALAWRRFPNRLFPAHWFASQDQKGEGRAGARLIRIAAGGRHLAKAARGIPPSSANLVLEPGNRSGRVAPPRPRRPTQKPPPVFAWLGLRRKPRRMLLPHRNRASRSPPKTHSP